jgi:O-antigen ligase
MRSHAVDVPFAVHIPLFNKILLFCTPIVYLVAILTILKVFFIYLALLFYLTVLAYIINGKGLMPVIGNSYLLIALFALFGSSTFWSIYPDETIFKVGLHLFYVLFYLSMVYFFVSCDGRRIMVFSFSMIPIIFFVLNMILSLVVGNIRAENFSQGSVIGSYGNHMVAINEISIPIVAYGIITKLMDRKFLVASFVLTMLNVLISQSRGGLLIMVLSIFMVMVFLRLDRRSVLLYLSILLMLIFVGVGVFSTMSFFKKAMTHSVERVTETFIEDDIDTLRTLSFVFAVDTINEYPVLGIGFGAFSRAMEETYGLGIVPHNVIITLWTGAGIPALLLFALLILQVVVRGFKAIRAAPSQNDALWHKTILIAMFMVILHGLVRPLLDNPIFYMLLACALSARPPRSLSTQNSQAGDSGWAGVDHEVRHLAIKDGNI